MKRFLMCVLIIILFALYISPMVYGLITDTEQWTLFGLLWLIFGWIPILTLGAFLENEIKG